MRLLIILIAFDFFFVRCYDVKDLIKLESVEQKISAVVNFFKTINPKMLDKKFNEMVDGDKQKWLLDRLASRNDLIRILKIIFKIISFKKIMKFFIITGFLFFFPVMNKNNIESNSRFSPDDDLDLYAFINRTDYRSIERYNFFIHAIEGFSNPLMVWCVAEHDAYCRFQNMFDVIDQLYPFDQMFNRFLPNSTIFNMQLMIDKISPFVRTTLISENSYDIGDTEDDSFEEDDE